MRISAQASWFLLPFLWAVVDGADTNSGVVEVDLVFPRNDTYAPRAWWPVIFTFQNKGLAPFLNPTIKFTIRDINNDSSNFMNGDYSFLSNANYSDSEPVYLYREFDLNKETSWALAYEITWDNCIIEPISSAFPLGFDLVTNTSRNFIEFTTKAGAQEVDLAASTSRDDNCPADTGVAINVTGTYDIFNGFAQGCAVVASPIPTVTPSPCQVKIDSAAAASISASITADACQHTDLVTPVGVTCPAKDSAQHLVVGSVACLALGLGALLQLLLF